MKKLMMVLPLAILLAYCSGPNNTQTTDTDVDATSTSASTTATTADMATTSGDVSDTTITSSTTATGTITSTSINSNSTQGDISASVTATTSIDPNDPMYQHWQRTNAQHWTYDMDYPGFDRPVAGSYNSAVNGNWQLVMTPELVTAWRQDDSRSLWMNSSDTYLSASESFNTQNGVSGTANMNSSNAGTHGLNNSASGNATVANQMNGGTANSSANTTVSANANITTGVSGSESGTAGTTGTTGVNADMTNSGAVNGTTNINNTTGSMDVNSINYNAANGNMYQLPKFNLYLDNGSFTGYTGCNGISGRVEVTGTGLRFLNTNTSTVIDCMGGLDETALLDMLKRVDSYTYVGDELQLMQGSQVLLRFKKDNQDTSLK